MSPHLSWVTTDLSAISLDGFRMERLDGRMKGDAGGINDELPVNQQFIFQNDVSSPPHDGGMWLYLGRFDEAHGRSRRDHPSCLMIQGWI
jgi:hypothetical protein